MRERVAAGGWTLGVELLLQRAPERGLQRQGAAGGTGDADAVALRSMAAQFGMNLDQAVIAFGKAVPGALGMDAVRAAMQAA